MTLETTNGRLFLLLLFAVHAVELTADIHKLNQDGDANAQIGRCNTVVSYSIIRPIRHGDTTVGVGRRLAAGSSACSECTPGTYSASSGLCACSLVCALALSGFSIASRSCHALLPCMLFSVCIVERALLLDASLLFVLSFFRVWPVCRCE